MHRYLGRRGPVPKVSETGAERRDVWCQAGRLAVNPTNASKLKRDKVIIGGLPTYTWVAAIRIADRMAWPGEAG